MHRPWQRRRLHPCAWLAGLALAVGVTGAAAAPVCAPPPPPPGAEQLQAAQRSASDRGLLWRLSKEGRDSYLFGTIHVGKLQWSFPGPALSRALARSDLLALEIDLGDP
ncbi:MAG TPA: TraB/GumN family protein, partial [Rubrivivax sp.]|nr:TraB/GumN family protein [Rubrivivax sp.]